MLDKDSKKRFFEESFLLADIKLDIVLGMLFLTMSNTDVDFQAQDLQWRFHITTNILLTTKQVELIGKKKFIVAALDLEYEAFIVYVVAFNIDLGDKMHPLKKA